MARGGYRAGAGRPKGTGPWGEETKSIRVPISLVPLVTKILLARGMRLPYFSLQRLKNPDLNAPQKTRYFDIGKLFATRFEKTFLLQVQDKSLINDTIRMNDLLVVNRQNKVAVGDFVVATVNEKSVIGSLKSEKTGLVFNPQKSKRKIPIAGIEIIGVVKKVIRQF